MFSKVFPFSILAGKARLKAVDPAAHFWPHRRD
jgi:hypothetical protein